MCQFCWVREAVIKQSSGWKLSLLTLRTSCFNFHQSDSLHWVPSPAWPPKNGPNPGHRPSRTSAGRNVWVICFRGQTLAAAGTGHQQHINDLAKPSFCRDQSSTVPQGIRNNKHYVYLISIWFDFPSTILEKGFWNVLSNALSHPSRYWPN